jgi:hypothetical protein
LKGLGIGHAGKSASFAKTQQYGEASAELIESVIRLPRKSSKRLIDKLPVPETDTGSQGENPEVLE